MKFVLKSLFALVMIGGMAVLVVVVGGGAKDGQQAIDAWAEQIRQGKSVDVGGGENEPLTALIRASKTTSFRNFQSQSDTSCFWVTLDDAARTELRVVLSERSGKQVVIAASSLRECDCPDDASEHCHLE
ncbi:MAG: hypothetical protein JNM17_35845 [Archangium sp.]|nr:hypothetical protein [Archangium sp.]